MQLRVSGLSTKPYSLPGAQVHDKLVAFDVDEGAKGRGGMAAKVQAAWMAAEKGCTTVILNGKQPDCILQVPF